MKPKLPVFVRHTVCDTDVIVKYVRLEGEEHATVRTWCSTCARVVIPEELNRPGPYVASLPRDTIAL